MPWLFEHFTKKIYSSVFFVELTMTSDENNLNVQLHARVIIDQIDNYYASFTS